MPYHTGQPFDVSDPHIDTGVGKQKDYTSLINFYANLQRQAEAKKLRDEQAVDKRSQFFQKEIDRAFNTTNKLRNGLLKYMTHASPAVKEYVEGWAGKIDEKLDRVVKSLQAGKFDREAQQDLTSTINDPKLQLVLGEAMTRQKRVEADEKQRAKLHPAIRALRPSLREQGILDGKVNEHGDFEFNADPEDPDYSQFTLADYNKLKQKDIMHYDGTPDLKDPTTGQVFKKSEEIGAPYAEYLYNAFQNSQLTPQQLDQLKRQVVYGNYENEENGDDLYQHLYGKNGYGNIAEDDIESQKAYWRKRNQEQIDAGTPGWTEDDLEDMRKTYNAQLLKDKATWEDWQANDKINYVGHVVHPQRHKGVNVTTNVSPQSPNITINQAKEKIGNAPIDNSVVEGETGAKGSVTDWDFLLKNFLAGKDKNTRQILGLSGKGFGGKIANLVNDIKWSSDVKGEDIEFGYSNNHGVLQVATRGNNYLNLNANQKIGEGNFGGYIDPKHKELIRSLNSIITPWITTKTLQVTHSKDNRSMFSAYSKTDDVHFDRMIRDFFKRRDAYLRANKHQAGSYSLPQGCPLTNDGLKQWLIDTIGIKVVSDKSGHRVYLVPVMTHLPNVFSKRLTNEQIAKLMAATKGNAKKMELALANLLLAKQGA